MSSDDTGDYGKASMLRGGKRAMAQTALTQLQDQIEAVRREAYAAGYAAAMQAIRDFAAQPATGAAPVAPASRRGRRPAAPAEGPRPGRGRRPRAAAGAAPAP